MSTTSLLASLPQRSTTTTRTSRAVNRAPGAPNELDLQIGEELRWGWGPLAEPARAGTDIDPK